MAAPDVILQLVERFEAQKEAYHSTQYNETQLRREFLDPFFGALGWDVDNRQGYAEAYKDVVHEDAIKIGGATKAPDYCFRIGGTRKFFVEAKKPSVNLRDDISAAFQLRRYGWSAKLPLSILSDFDELAVYDCRVRPVKTDKASNARVLYFSYTDYAQRWDEIASVFSREAILKGSFDKYAESSKGKKGTAEVDDAFLKEIESWRDNLARNLAIRNPTLTSRELNYAVQTTIDRIIFLRICEDRGIEEYGRLMALQNGNNVYDRMCILFRQADDRYNSGLFHFQKEKDRPDPADEISLKLAIDDKPLKEIIRTLYYPDSPYEFSVLPADILGQVYEQFLGKVIRLTAGHRAVVEDKPEVKKAGGVYYTPTYIVDYIVKNTVGKLLEGKTPQQVTKLKVLDPACGSGSFLIGAYQYLLDWHHDWYVSDGTEKWATGRNPRLYQGMGDEWRLTTAERKRILLNNIYGVDIDPQAVEVTKLSLLLKVLEGENQQTLNRQLTMFHERALPDLGQNIKCGNSLIGPDFYDNQQMSFLDEEERYRINVFDWNAEFLEIMKGGGFDAVIGNPPYIRIQTMKEWAPLEVEHYKQRYRAASKGNYDIYVVFIERSLNLTKKAGRSGFILPHKFFNAQYGQPLREILSMGKHLDEVVHFGHQQVFFDAATYTCLLFLSKDGSSHCTFKKVNDLGDWRVSNQATSGVISAVNISSSEWNFSIGRHAKLAEKLGSMTLTLGDIAERMAQGIRTSANEIFVMDLISTEDDIVEAYSKQLDRKIRIERTLLSPFLQGREIKPYRVQVSSKFVLIPYKVKNGRAVLIGEQEISENLPLTYAYLLENKLFLQNRERGRMRGPNWYAFSRLQNIELMSCMKILIPDIADKASFALDKEGRFALTSGYGITLKAKDLESSKYVLGLLNSKLLDYYLKTISTPMRGGFFRYFTQFIEKLPIRAIDHGNEDDASFYEHLVSLVDQMLQLYSQLASAKTAHDQSLLQRQITTTDRQINQLVYELYGLTDEEIRIVEESVR